MTTQESSALASQALSYFWPDGTPHNYIDGKLVGAQQWTKTTNPSTGETLAKVPDSSASDVQSAVDAATAAQTTWKQLTYAQRADYLARVRESLIEHAEELALLEALDSGNPLAYTQRDIGLALKYLSEWPGIAKSFSGRFTKPHDDGYSLVTHEPYGVVGKIIAYNHPMLFALAGSIFPLMAGNTMVIKASDQTPLATLALAKIVDEILPPGVVNILAGGVEAGDALVVHPDVKRIAFTGSDATALVIQQRLSASGMVKHFSAELGGKNAFIICEDSDVEEASEAAFAGLSFLVSAGQSCQSTAKILVHSSVYEQVVEYMKERMDTLRVGPAYADDTEMGPLVSAQHLDNVQSLVDSGVAEGATLVTGGKRLFEQGYYLAPTLFTDVREDMRIFNEEIFGPVALIMQFENEAEAIKLTNQTPYGLSAAVWTRNIDRAFRIATEIRAGYVWVNDANRHYPGAPFGGMGSSGIGREESIEELQSFMETKSINIKVKSAQ